MPPDLSEPRADPPTRPSADGPTAVVVAAHGSRAASANEAHRALVDALDALVPEPVSPAFLELVEPDIGSAIDQAIASGATAVSVLPYFLHPGRHLLQDIPAIVEAARGRHPGVEVRLLGSFGADPAIPSILAAMVRAARPDPSA